MNIQVQLDDIVTPLRWDEAGGIRIGKSRVTLDSLIAAYYGGACPEEIAIQYPTLELADIYSVLGFYLRHMEGVDAYLAERAQQAERERRTCAEQFGLMGLRERLLHRQKTQPGH